MVRKLLIRLAFVAIALVLSSCGKDWGIGITPPAPAGGVSGFWKDAVRPKRYFVFGQSRVMWDSSYDKNSFTNLTVVASYQVDGSTLTRGSIGGLTVGYRITSLTDGGLTFQDAGGRSTSLVRMSDGEVATVFGDSYVGRPAQLVAKLDSRPRRMVMGAAYTSAAAPSP